MRPALGALLIAALASTGGRAEAQLDAGLRWPALAPEGLLLVRGAAVVPHLDSAIGLDLDLGRKPIVLRDRAVGVEHLVVETRLASTLLYAVGLFDHSQVTLAVPAVWQQGEGRVVLTRDEGDALPAGAAGDLRLDFQHAIAQPWQTADGLGLAVASGLLIPTGDEAAFAGEAAVAGYLEAAAQGAVPLAGAGSLRLGGAIGIRARETARLAGSAVGSELSLAAALGLELFDARLILAAEGLALVGLVEDAGIPILALGEARVALGRRRFAEVALGVGAGIGDALRTPSFQALLAVRYVPRADRARAPGP